MSEKSCMMSGEDLAIEYAELKRMFVVYGFGESYCESNTYDNFMFFEANTLNEVFSNLLEYMKKTFRREKTFEFNESFEPAQFDILTEGWRIIRVVNCSYNQMDFTNKENELEIFLIDNKFKKSY